MSDKEATARIKINKLLEAAGWRFFDETGLPANICPEPDLKVKSQEIDEMNNDFDKKIHATMVRVWVDEASVSPEA